LLYNYAVEEIICKEEDKIWHQRANGLLH